MELSDKLYDYRKTAVRFAIENVTEFKAAFKAAHGKGVTSVQVYAALKDKDDVRNFSAGGQAKNLIMCTDLCIKWKLEGKQHVSELGFSGETIASSCERKAQLKCFLSKTGVIIDRCMAPMNQDEACGFRRPNHHYNGAHLEQDITTVVKTIDDLLRHELGLGCFDLPNAFIRQQLQYKKKGHVYQYICSIVLSYYEHEASSGEYPRMALLMFVDIQKG
jgi:hypothetical protein